MSLSNTWLHSSMGTAVAIATTDAPPMAKVAIVLGLFASHMPMDMIPHAHVVDLKWFDERRSYVLEAWTGLLVIPLIAWFLTGTNFYWGFVCCNAPNLFDYFCFFGWKWADRFNKKIHPWVDKCPKGTIILADTVSHTLVLTALSYEIISHLRP